jgi:acyl-CoA synthetase (AMP-forming)/AMP-acid ligase II
VCANARAADAELAYILADSGATVVITDAAHLDTALALVASDDRPARDSSPGPDGRPAPDGRPTVIGPDDYHRLLATEPTAAPRDGLGLDEVAWMLYTSGTTGRPKGVYLTQRGCLWVVAACWAPIVGLGPHDVVASPLPLFHSYALVLCVLGILAVGATERILDRFSPAEVLDLLRDGVHGAAVTLLPGVPTMFHYLLRRLSESGSGPEHRLRCCVSAGAIMPAALNAEFERVFRVPLLDGYGITETSTMVTMNWPVGGRVYGSCGLPLPGLTLRLIDPLTGADALPGGEGEIWVQGPNVTPGYHNLPEATAAAVTDGWYHTGDLARRDEHGYLRISGRTKEVIIRGGQNIYPAEVEDALLACPGVADAAVIGVADEGLGEVPIGFVVAGDGFRADTVLAECGRRLTYYKVPTRLIEIDEIPRTGSGKVLRFRLRETLRGAECESATSRYSRYSTAPGASRPNP